EVGERVVVAPLLLEGDRVDQQRGDAHLGRRVQRPEGGDRLAQERFGARPVGVLAAAQGLAEFRLRLGDQQVVAAVFRDPALQRRREQRLGARSEERRVGKEGGTEWWREQSWESEVK